MLWWLIREGSRTFPDNMARMGTEVRLRLVPRPGDRVTPSGRGRIAPQSSAEEIRPRRFPSTLIKDPRQSVRLQASGMVLERLEYDETRRLQCDTAGEQLHPP